MACSVILLSCQNPLHTHTSNRRPDTSAAPSFLRPIVTRLESIIDKTETNFIYFSRQRHKVGYGMAFVLRSAFAMTSTACNPAPGSPFRGKMTRQSTVTTAIIVFIPSPPDRRPACAGNDQSIDRPQSLLGVETVSMTISKMLSLILSSSSPSCFCISSPFPLTLERLQIFYIRKSRKIGPEWPSQVLLISSSCLSFHCCLMSLNIV